LISSSALVKGQQLHIEPRHLGSCSHSSISHNYTNLAIASSSPFLCTNSRPRATPFINSCIYPFHYSRSFSTAAMVVEGNSSSRSTMHQQLPAQQTRSPAVETTTLNGSRAIHSLHRDPPIPALRLLLFQLNTTTAVAPRPATTTAPATTSISTVSRHPHDRATG
jgi:hypothetical protein